MPIGLTNMRSRVFPIKKGLSRIPCGLLEYKIVKLSRDYPTVGNVIRGGLRKG